MAYWQRVWFYSAKSQGKLHFLDTILSYAAEGNPFGSDENLKDLPFQRNETPLYIACVTGDVMLVQFALQKGSDVDEVLSVYEEKCIHVACALGFVEIVKCLLVHGADVNSLAGFDIEGVTPLHVAALCGHIDVIRVLMEYGTDDDDECEQSPLHMACFGGHLEVVKKLINDGSDVNKYSYEGRTPLHIAAHLGDPWVISVLLDAGADINALSTGDGYMNISGMSPLHLAVGQKQLEAAVILLKSGAKIDNPETSVSPLHGACHIGDRTMVELLLEHGANVDSKAKQNIHTPLHRASIEGHPEIVKLLVDAGANIHEYDFEGETPLHMAADRGHIGVIRVLLESGAQINMLSKKTNANEHEVSPLYSAVLQRKLEAAIILLESGAKIDIPGCTASPLHAACLNDDYGMVKLLLEHGADVNAQSTNSMETPLQTLMNRDSGYYNNVAELLLSHGADANLPDRYGFTVLFTALVDSDYPFVELLLEYGCDLSFSLDQASNLHDDFETKKALKKHFIKMKTAKMCSSGQNCEQLASHIPDSDLEDYQLMCGKEVSSMKTTRIGCTDVTYYDLLRRGASVCRNQEVVETLEQSGNFRDDFPIYGRLLTISFNRGLVRRKSLDEGYPAFAYLMKVDLPIVAADEIFSHLSNRDLKNLVALYKAVRGAARCQKAGTSREQLSDGHAGESAAREVKKREFCATEDDVDAPEDAAAAHPSKMFRLTRSPEHVDTSSSSSSYCTSEI